MLGRSQDVSFKVFKSERFFVYRLGYSVKTSTNTGKINSKSLKSEELLSHKLTDSE